MNICYVQPQRFFNIHILCRLYTTEDTSVYMHITGCITHQGLHETDVEILVSPENTIRGIFWWYTEFHPSSMLRLVKQIILVTPYSIKVVISLSPLYAYYVILMQSYQRNHCMMMSSFAASE